MHGSSIWHMQDCLNRYVVDKRPAGKVLEVGSGFGSAAVPPYKQMFLDIGWEYSGLDLGPGHNVDIVADDPFLWPIEDASFDAIISGQMMEHNSMFWLTFLEMGRVLKPGGIMIHIAPSRGYEHKVPTDNWRFYRDGMTALGAWSGLKCLEATTDWTDSDLEFLKEKRPAIYDKIPRKGKFGNGAWGDTVGIFEKPESWHPSEALRYLTAFTERLSPSARPAPANGTPIAVHELELIKNDVLKAGNLADVRTSLVRIVDAMQKDASHWDF